MTNEASVDERICPRCEGEMHVLVLDEQELAEFDLHAVTCCWECPQCGHRSETTWTAMD